MIFTGYCMFSIRFVPLTFRLALAEQVGYCSRTYGILFWLCTAVTLNSFIVPHSDIIQFCKHFAKSLPK